MKIYYFVFLLMLFIMGCNLTDRNNAYNTIVFGSELSVDNLKKAEQILKNGNELILLIDVSQQKGEYYNPHMFFWDSNLKLYSESYFASEMIDSVVNGKIFGILNNSRINRISSKVDNLPKGYQFNLIGDKSTGSMNYCKTVIKEIGLPGNSDTVILVVDKYRESITYPVKQEGIDFATDTLLLPLSKLKINGNLRKITTKEMDKTGYIIWEEMYLGESI